MMRPPSIPVTTPAAQPGRDTRLDAIRAVCLAMIFVNHVPGNPLEFITSKNFGFSDAAEIFVLISGVSAAYAYGRKFGPGQRFVTMLRAWRRAGVLYVAHLATTLATLCLFSLAALHFAVPGLLEAINIEPVFADPQRALIGIVTLGHQLGYNNILPLYAGILLLLPVFLAVGRISLGAMVGLSGLLWLVAGLWQIAPRDYPTDGFWFLNPLSWQFLFVIGLGATLHIRRGGSLPVSPFLVVAAAGYLAVSLAWVKVPLWGIDISFGLPAVLTGFDKTFLSLPRLLHVLSGAYLLAVIPALSGVFRVSPRNLLAVTGRHALPVFIAGTLLAMAAQAWLLAHPEASQAAKAGMVIAGLAAQILLALYLQWYGDLKRKAAQPSLPAVVAAVPPRPTRPILAGRIGSDQVAAREISH